MRILMIWMFFVINCEFIYSWICVWNVWFGWGILVLWNAIVYKCILYLYDFLIVLNLLWDVSYSTSVCLVCVWTKCHPCMWVSVRLWWWFYMRGLTLHFILLLILGLWMLWNNVTLRHKFYIWLYVSYNFEKVHEIWIHFYLGWL